MNDPCSSLGGVKEIIIRQSNEKISDWSQCKDEGTNKSENRVVSDKRLFSQNQV